MNGMIEARSPEETGAEFVIYIPVTETENPI